MNSEYEHATPPEAASRIRKAVRGVQLVAAVLLLFAFFRPWAQGAGISADALHLREQLRGPGQILAWVTRKGRVQRDEAWAGRVGWLGLAEGVALAAAVWPVLTPWPGLLTGVAALAGANWAGGEIAGYPFMHAGPGVALTFWAGLLLSVASGLRLPVFAAWLQRVEEAVRRRE